MAVITRIPGEIESVQTASTVSAVTMSVDQFGAQTYSSGGLRQGSCAKIDASGAGYHQVVQCGVSDPCYGVVLDWPAVGPSVPVQLQTKGIARVRAAAAFAANVRVAVTDTSGRVGTAPADAATTVYIVGVSLEAAAQVDDLVEVRLLPYATTIASS